MLAPERVDLGPAVRVEESRWPGNWVPVEAGEVGEVRSVALPAFLPDRGMAVEDGGSRGLCWESTGGYPPLLTYLVLAPYLLSAHQPSWGLALILAPLLGL